MYIAAILCVTALTLIETYEAYATCKVPRGDAGTCLDINKCKPMLELYKKKHKTYEENTFIRQAYCGNQATSKIKVCCPDSSTWDSLKISPIAFTNTLYELGIDTDNKQDSKPEPNLIQEATKRPTLLTQLKPNAIPLPLGRNPETDFVPKTSLDKEELVEDYDIIGQQVCGKDSSSGNKITGGEPAAIDQYPWLVLLEYSGGSLGCGGSLITSRFVLTAGHCVDSIYGIPKIARLGEYNTTSFPTDEVEVDGGGYETINVTLIAIEMVIKHHNFRRDSGTLSNDIGLAKLSRNAVFSDFIKIICLPTVDYVVEFTSGTNFTVAGWGDENVQTVYFDVKKHVTVPYVPMDECNKTNSRIVTDTQICAGGIQGEDSCKGDSGGPLMYEFNNTYFAVGVVSYGTTPCGIKEKPAVYTHVYKYLNWIKKNIKDNL